jgi:hypothetical protein
MSRFAFMARHPKRSLAVLALLLAATAVTIGSGANFTATAANPTNTFTAGALSIGLTPNTAIFTTATNGNIKPGMPALVGTVDIENSGNITGAFALSASNIVNTPAAPGLTSVLKIQVEDCGLWTSSNTVPPACTGATIVYPAGAIPGLSGLALGNYNGGSVAARDKHRFKISVTWPSNAPAIDNPLQNAQLSFDLKWDAS